MKRTIIILVSVVVLIGGAFGYFRYRRTQQAQALLGDLQTVEITRGALVASVGATGTVRSNQTATLVWETSGMVEQVNVKVGDKVSEGEELANLEQTSLSQNIILAQADLVSAQKALDDLYHSYEGVALATAEQAVLEAEKQVETMQTRLDSLTAPASQAAIDQAKANLVLAEQKLNRAKEAFEPYANKPEDNLMRATLQSQLSQAQADYDAAARYLNALLGTPSELDVEMAQANLDLAKAQLAQAQEDYQELLDGPTGQDIAAAEARIAAAQATLDMAHITAPFNGTITQASPKPGDLVTPSQVAFRLDDLSHLLVDVQVSEVDINRVQVGQDAVLTFDAILAKEYHGTVVEAAPVGLTQAGVVNFNVTVELTDADELVKPGMTAAVNIVVSTLDNVLLVPNRAVRVVDGQRVVYLFTGSAQLQQVAITLGASSDTYSEVTEGELNVGDVVVLNPPTEFGPQGPGGGFFGGGR